MMTRKLGLCFPVPEGYRREFVFEDSVSGIRSRIVFDGTGIEMVEEMGTEPIPKPAGDRLLDWIEECVVMVRKEVGSL